MTASPFKIRLACAIAGLLCGIVQGGEGSEPLFRRQTESCMGTKWHIALYADDAESANRAFSLAWDEIREIDRCLTNYSADSELSKFCSSGPHSDFIKVSEHLATVVRAAAEVSRQSDGYFDITIAPVANLWRRARATHRLPAESKLRAARELVDYRFVELGKACRLMRINTPRVKLDLGGIAKGYAVDRALAKLRSTKGIRAGLVNGGGDLAAFGETPEAQGWVVEIARVDGKAGTRKLTLRDAALATSGDAWKYLEVDGTRYSHLIDPKTGIGSTRRLTVSVFAPTCMQADSLASALSVMPIAKGLELASKLDGVGARLVEVAKSDDVTVRESYGFPAFE